MPIAVHDKFDWPVPYPNIPRDGRSMKEGFAKVWGRVVDDIEVLEVVELAAKKNIRVQLTVDEQQAIFRINPFKSWVYFLLAKDTGMVKIGKTTSPKKRITCLRTMSPVKLEVVALVRAHDYHEAMIHKALSKYRAHGEWFRMEGDVIDLIKKAAEGGIRPLHEYICRSAIDAEESIV